MHNYSTVCKTGTMADDRNSRASNKKGGKQGVPKRMAVNIKGGNLDDDESGREQGQHGGHPAWKEVHVFKTVYGLHFQLTHCH